MHPTSLRRRLWWACAAHWGLFAFSAAGLIAAPSSGNWGGTVVEDRVPYQPEMLLDHWVEDTDPVDLETVVTTDEAVRVAGVSNEMIPPGDELAAETNSQLSSGARNGIFQKALFAGTWLPQLEDDSLGWSDLEAAVILGLPLLHTGMPLIITPRYAVHYLDGAENFDLPDKLYDASVEFRTIRKIADGPWAMDVAVTLGHFSDYEGDDADAFLVLGRGLAIYQGESGVNWILGAAYVNIGEARVLPVVGFVYAPTPAITYELIFPRPRVAWQLPWSDQLNGDERWAYVAGEFAGGLWSIEHPTSGVQERMASSDVRVLAGYERKLTAGISRRFEVGYVFGRQLSFSSGTPDVELDNTLFARVGLSY
jgi:hypothetical protein